jgi:uncharacterized PurR-regulated membrane protein YhhQ (DUF165 family)
MHAHMATAVRPNWALIIRQAVFAGFISAVVFDLYVWLTTVLPGHGSVVAMLQHSASIALGPIAFTGPNYVWAGVLVDLVSSMAWAGGYAYFAQRQPFVNTRWALSGFFYGFVVYVLTLALLLGAHAFVVPATPQALFNDVLARTVFFGIPLAFVVAQLDRP